MRRGLLPGAGPDGISTSRQIFAVDSLQMQRGALAYAIIDCGRRQRGPKNVLPSPRPSAGTSPTADLCYFINTKRAFSTISMRCGNADANSPCCLPQTRRTPPCYRPLTRGANLLDLNSFLPDRASIIRCRIQFSPCSQGGGGNRRPDNSLAA